MSEYDELLEALDFTLTETATDAAVAIRTLLREREEMQAHIDALQARVHLCAGYEQALRERDELRAANESARVCKDHLSEFIGSGCLVCERDEAREEAAKLDSLVRYALAAHVHPDMISALIRDALARGKHE